MKKHTKLIILILIVTLFLMAAARWDSLTIRRNASPQLPVNYMYNPDTGQGEVTIGIYNIDEVDVYLDGVKLEPMPMWEND